MQSHCHTTFNTAQSLHQPSYQCRYSSCQIDSEARAKRERRFPSALYTYESLTATTHYSRVDEQTHIGSPKLLLHLRDCKIQTKQFYTTIMFGLQSSSNFNKLYYKSGVLTNPTSSRCVRYQHDEQFKQI